MAIKEKDQPGRAKPNESENQPQYASEDEVPPEERREQTGEDELARKREERQARGGQPPTRKG